MNNILHIRPKVRLLFRGASSKQPYDLIANEVRPVPESDITHIDKNDFTVEQPPAAATPPRNKGVEEMTIKELRAYAEEQKIEIPTDVTRRDVIEQHIRVEIARRKSASTASPDKPTEDPPGTSAPSV